MRIAFALCALALFACKREEDPTPVTTTTTTTTATASAPAQTSAGPTQLVALAQPADSAAPTPSPTPTLAQTQTQTPTPTPTQTQTAHTSSVVVGSVAANGLPAASVQSVMQKNAARYKQCYDAGLRGNPALRGRMLVRLTIDATGQIASAEDGGSDLQDSTVTNCVFQTLGTVVFPQPEAGSATATVAIVFIPTS